MADKEIKRTGYDPYANTPYAGRYAGIFRDWNDFVTRVPGAKGKTGTEAGFQESMRQFYKNAPGVAKKDIPFAKSIGRIEKDISIQGRFGATPPTYQTMQSQAFGFGPTGQPLLGQFDLPGQYRQLVEREQDLAGSYRTNEEIDRRRATAARMQQEAAINMLGRRASGRDSIVALQGQAEKDALARAIASRAASAQGGAYNPAVARAAIYAQSGLGQSMAADLAARAAQERLDAQRAYYEAATGLRGQDVASQQLEGGFGMDYEKLGMAGTELGNTAKQQAWQRYMNALGLETGAESTAKGLAYQTAQNISDKKTAIAQQAIGAATGAASAGVGMLSSGLTSSPAPQPIRAKAPMASRAPMYAAAGGGGRGDLDYTLDPYRR